MDDWTGLINLINYLGDKIESSGLPPWLTWPLFVLIFFLVCFLVIRIFWQVGNRVDQKMEEGQGIQDYAEVYKIMDEQINNEHDPEKKAILIKKRDNITHSDNLQ